LNERQGVSNEAFAMSQNDRVWGSGINGLLAMSFAVWTPVKGKGALASLSP